jgi:hypothetical protein
LTDGFDPIGLDELGTAGLMERFDTKVLVPARLASDLLERCSHNYHMLEVKGSRQATYRTQYFDTDDLRLYHAHHSGRTPRYKIRVRTYGANAERFLEVKLKSGKGQTRKERVRLDGLIGDPLDHLDRGHFLGVHRVVSVDELRHSLLVEYVRIALVDKMAAERVTLDLAVSFTASSGAITYPDLMFVEIKQQRRERSVAMTALRGFGLRPGGLSKYCLGIAALPIAAKKNRFKPMVRLAARLNGESPTVVR